jgi:hypothetical protein
MGLQTIRRSLSPRSGLIAGGLVHQDHRDAAPSKSGRACAVLPPEKIFRSLLLAVTSHMRLSDSPNGCYGIVGRTAQFIPA